MRVADAHCHLDADYFQDGPEPAIERAREAGVVGFVVVGLASPEKGAETLASPRFAVDLARRLPDAVTACVGLHPHDAKGWTPALEGSLRELARDPHVTAIGEVGLDYHYDHSPREVQREVFARFIALARELGKPIVVHTRSAPEDTLSILESSGARDVGGIIHCFTEDRDFARRALDLDFDLSFSGVVTFKTAQSVQDVAGWAPVHRILVETDSPYLAPVPFRGKKCEPALVTHTAKRVAEIRGIPAEELCRITLENTERRFVKVFGQASRHG